MRNIIYIKIIYWIAIFSGFSTAALSQSFEVKQKVISNGSELTSSTNFQTRGIVGQAAIGVSSGTSFNHIAGFSATLATDAPGNVNAIAVSATQVDISWIDNSSGETEFIVERSTSSTGTFTQIGTAAAEAITFSDTDATPNTTFFYRIKANYGTTTSAYSNIASANTSFTDYALLHVGSPVFSNEGSSWGNGWADFDNDGNVDLWVADQYETNRHFKNNGDGTFTALSNALTTEIDTATSISWGDYDNDGNLDAFVTIFNNRNNKLFKNNGDGTFTKITTGDIVNEGGNSYSAAWADYDNDGFIDLFVANAAANFLYNNNGDGTFTKVTTGDIVTEAIFSPGAAWADYDLDGDPDLLVTNVGGGEKSFFINNGDGTFTKLLTGAIATDLSSSVSVSWQDYNSDGFPDVLVTGYGGPNDLYQNNGDGTFTKITGTGLEGATEQHTGSAWGDYNNDGFQDIYIAVEGGRDYLYTNDGTGIFTSLDAGPIADNIQTTFGVSWGDYNNDGNLDLFASAQDGYAFYKNNGNSNNWISVKLNGAYSNSAAIGARIELDAGGKLQYRTVTTQSGFAGQNQLTQHFGLGASGTIDKITIFWPSGVIQVLENITANQILNITENNTPTDITLISTSIEENNVIGATVSKLTTVDPDASDSHTYSLMAGTGDTDNASFTITGDALEAAIQFDFETKSSYSIRLRTTDPEGASFEKSFTITITDVNEAPTDIALSNNTIPEDQSEGTSVGRFTSTDPEAGDTFTYSLVAGTGDTDNGSFVISGDSLYISIQPDFEQQASFSIRVQTTDAGGLTFQKSFTITITDVNEKPADITLSNSTLDENVATGTAVGVFSTTDPDAGDSFTYSLIAGTGDADNASFIIDANTLHIDESPDFEVKNSYSIRVQSTDAGGLAFEKLFTITISDVNEPPTDVALSSSSIDENVATGTTVGVFSTTDPDAGDSFIYSLIAGTGDTDNASFAIDATSLNIIINPDFEVKSSYSIRVQSTDAGGLSSEKIFAVTISDVNEAPTDITLDNNTIAEGDAVGRTVGVFSTIDEDAGDNFTYNVVTGTGDHSLFQINGDILETAGTLSAAQGSYNIRVRSADSGGLEVEKEFTITVTTADSEPPQFTLSNVPVTVDDGFSSSTFTIDVTDNSSVSGVELHYRGLAAVNWTTETLTNTTGSSYEINLRESWMDQSGLEIYFTATDNASNTATSENKYIHKSYASQNFSGLDFGTAIEDYQIIAIPLELTDKKVSTQLEDDLGPYDNTIWRLFSYNNSSNSYQESSGPSSLNTGKGYFLISKDTKTIDIENGTVVNASQSNPYSIQLQAGWNLIGNPYLFNIGWSDILGHNGLGTDHQLAIYNRGFDKSATSINAWRGAFVFAPDASTLKIPMVDNGVSDNGGRIYGEQENLNPLNARNWEVNFDISSEEKTEFVGGVGMHSEASNSKDMFDRIALPKFLQYLQINFDHPEYFAPKFERDVVPSQESYRWEFTVENNLEANELTISWKNDYFGDNKKQIYLYDPVQQIVVNMREQNEYTFTNNNGQVFQVYYGNGDFIEGELMPYQASLGQAYPNPFNSFTNIPYTLGEGSDIYHVKIQIYDLVGNEVAVLIDDTQGPGFYETQWNGTNKQGASVNPGFYIYRLSIGDDFHFTRKLIRQ